MVLDQPGGPRRDEALQGLQRRRHVLPRIDRLAHVVQQRRQQKLLVVGQLLAGQLEDLQAVVEQVAFRMGLDGSPGSSPAATSSLA